MMRKTYLLALAFLTCLAYTQTIDEGLLRGLKWRNLGPFRGGRVTAVAGVVGQVGTFYMGLPQGGVWKTTSAGQVWFPVFDSIKETSTIGSIAVAPSDPNVVYVGTGEVPAGGSGYGVYKSTDAGKTWAHLGLEDSRIVPAILVDPKDPDTVLVAAAGDRKTKDTRGVFRSTNAGKTWEKSLFVDADTGVVAMSSAYDHPEIVMAGTHNPANVDKCKLYRSADFGKSWTKLEGKGLPALRGRYCISIAQNTNSQRIFVIGQFGLYRSDDGGANWRRMAENDRRIMNGQGGYNSGVFVDTQNPDIVYTISTCLYRSTDGGNTFEGFKGAPGGDDPHFLWIDPTNGKRILYGGDQGATVSLDGGDTWGSWYNQPSAQVYHIATDDRFPYWVYASQQDSGVVGTASRGNYGQVGPLDWTPHPGFEVGYVAIDPLNPAISFALSATVSLCRVQNPSGQWVEVGAVGEAGEALRSAGLPPICFSPTNPHELLAGYQFLMSSTDGGQHWRKLGGDLAARPNPVKDPKDKPTYSHGSISTFSVSPADGKVIWVGTTNGMIQVTRDHGDTWTRVTEGLPAESRAVGCLDASHLDPATAYASFGNPDGKPRIFRTHDYGAHWTEVANGLPKDGPFGSVVNVVRCDSKCSGLLFAGTNNNLFASFDDGDHWQSLMLNLPTTIMNDMLIKGDDLVVGTYGRGIWVLDDIGPLRQFTASMKSEPAHLFKPSVGIRVRRNVNDDTPMPPDLPHADNPPDGVCIDYALGTKPNGPITLEILDGKGKVVRHMTSAEPEPYADPKPEVAPYWIGKRKPLAAEIGLNRANWDIRYDDPVAFVHDVQDVMTANAGLTKEAVPGPLALPGRYTVRLTVDGKAYEQPLEIKNDPRSPASQSDLEKLHRVEMDLLACIQAGWDSRGVVVSMRQSLADATKSTVKEVADAAKAFDEKLATLQGKVTYTRRFFFGPNQTNFVNHNIYLLVVLGSFSTGDAAPSEAILASYASSYYLTAGLLDKLRELTGEPLADLNAVLAKNGLKPVTAAAVPPNPPLPIEKYRRKAGAGIGKPGQRFIPDDPDRGGDGGLGW
ncbi:MAG: WD40/YVTN/BNR-like repeat-containing protein [Fimbriimonadales bacterium]